MIISDQWNSIIQYIMQVIIIIFLHDQVLHSVAKAKSNFNASHTYSPDSVCSLGLL